MKNRMLGVGFALGLIVGLFTPVAAADKETRQMMADIRMLQEQTQQLQNLIGALGKTMSEALETSLKAVNTRIDAKVEEQTNATRTAFANQKLTIDAITRDLGVLREKVDENNVRVGSLTQEVNALRQLVTQLTARSSFDPVFGPPDGATPADSAVATTPVPAGGLGMSPAAAFEQSYSDYTSSRYESAISGFEAYVKNFPDSVQAARAQVKICDAYIQLGNYARAVQACDLAIKNYPTSDTLAEAYYRKAQGLRGLKRNDEARVAFQYVVKTFPNSQEAALATTQLMALTPPAASRP